MAITRAFSDLFFKVAVQLFTGLIFPANACEIYWSLKDDCNDIKERAETHCIVDFVSKSYIPKFFRLYSSNHVN